MGQKLEEFDFSLRERKFSLKIKRVGWFGKIFGLMFRSKRTDNLLFEFDKKIRIGIHSYFVFFEFLVLFLDDKNRLIEMKTMKPFKVFKPKKEFYKFVEIPINEKNKNICLSLEKRKI
ncbi:hypothetical protein ACFL0X_01575 [Nanoarchaeota archaeon]